LAAGFCPDPLGELKRSPDHNMGPTSKGRGGMGRRKGEGEAPPTRLSGYATGLNLVFCCV